MWTRKAQHNLSQVELLTLDQEFITWLEKWIGREAYLKIPPAKLRHGAPMMNSFETCKFHFSGEEDELDVTLPKECEIDDDEEKNIADRVLTIKRYGSF